MNSKFKTAAIAAITSGVLAGAMFASAQTTMSTGSYCFTQNMKLGTTNSEVLTLQQTLNAKGFTVSTTGVGSMGMETNYFGAKTQAAVKKFQAANGVINTGNVFSLTRAALNVNCAGSVVNPTTPTSTPVVSGPVSVSLAASQPNNVLVAGSVNGTVTNLNFVGNGTVTNVKLQRLGVSNNDTISNVYLYDTLTGARLTDAASVLTDGTVNFTSGYGIFTVAGSRAITVKVDIASAGTSGQSVGFAVTGYTTLGNPTAVVTGVNGPALPIGSATIATASLVSTTSVAASIDAGRQNVVFWEAVYNTTKDSYLSGGLFSFIGSAPYSVFANLKLYVDGIQIGNAVTIDQNGRVTFTGSNFLKAGNHTITLRGDVTGGAGRDFYVRLENSGLSFEDANIRGVYGTVTPTSAVRIPTLTNVTINSCSSTNCSLYSSDSAFTGMKVVSGASQQTIGKYTFKAVGEATKFMTGKIGITGTVTTGDIRNVSIFIDGVQVVSGKTLALAGTTVDVTNLGGVVVEMGKTVTIEVKADIASSTGIALPSQTLTSALTLEVQGQDSKNSTTYSALSSNPVTVSSLNATFTNNSNFTGSKVSGTQSNVRVGSYTISTGNEAVRLTAINVTFTPTTVNLSTVNNFRLMDGSTTVYSQSTVGSGVAASTVSTSPFIEIPANTTKTFDVLVDLNNSGTTGSLSVAAVGKYQGMVSLTSSTDSLNTTTAQVTTVSTPVLASISKASSALSARNVVGGTVNNAAVFTLTANGTSFTATKMQVFVSNASAVSAVTIAGVNAINRGNGVYSADTNVNIATIGTDVPVNVTFNTANRDTNTLSGATTTIGLSYVYGSTGSSIVIKGVEDTATAAITASATTTSTSSAFTIVGAYPTVKMTNNTNTVSPGTFTNATLGTVTITPVGGTVSVSQFGVNLPTGVTSARIVDSNGNVVTNATLSAGTAGAQTVTVTSGNISSAVTYTIQGSGTQSGTNSVVLGASLGDVSTLKWIDVSGDSTNTTKTGDSLLPNYNN